MKNVWQQLKPHYQIKIRQAAHKYHQLKDLSIHLWLQMVGMIYD